METGSDLLTSLANETQCSLCHLYSRPTLLCALTVQLREDAPGDCGCLDHAGPGEATGRGEHGDVVHKLLVEEPPFVAELGPQEVAAEPLHASLSLSQKQKHSIRC